VANHSVPGWADAVEPVDVVFDGIGGEIGLAAFGLVRPGGRFSEFGLALAAEGRLRSVIGQTFPLEEAAAAHAAIEARSALGKTLLIVRAG
jgi:NADPH2:quinone reductase